MKINDVDEKLMEAGWWEQQAKRVGTKVASKVLPKSLGGSKMKGASWVRERISSLMNAWKEAQGAGYEPTRRNLETWLKGGDKPASPEVLKQTSKSIKLQPDVQLNNSQLRDYFKTFAQNEFKTSGMTSPEVTGGKAAAQEPAAQTKTDKKIVDTIQSLYDRVIELETRLKNIEQG